MKSQLDLDDFKTWLGEYYDTDTKKIGISDVRDSPVIQEEGWKLGHLKKIQTLIDSNQLHKAREEIKSYTPVFFNTKIHILNEKIFQLNNPFFLNSVYNGTSSLAVLTPENTKKSELETTYKLFSTIKNYLLFLNFQLTLLPANEKPETMLDKESVFAQFNGLEKKLLRMLINIKLNLLKYPEIFLREFIEKFLLEIKIESKSLEALYTLALFERNIFREGDAELLKRNYFKLEPDFQRIAADENPGCFYAWLPCVTPPLMKAKQQLSAIKKIDIEDEMTAYTVLAIFLKVYRENASDEKFKQKMDQCFENALLVQVEYISPDMQKLADQYLDKYQHLKNSEKSDGVSIKMQQLERQGYRLLK